MYAGLGGAFTLAKGRDFEAAHLENPLQAQITNRSDAVDGLTRKDRSGPVLTFDPAVWSAFVDDIKAGEFDLPR